MLDEQARIRKSGVPEPSQAELFVILRECYETSKSSSTDGRVHPLIPDQKISRSPDSDIDSLVLQMPKEFGPWVDSLLQILRSGHLIAIEAIQRNLVAFKELVALAGEHKNPGDPGKTGSSTGRLPGRDVETIHSLPGKYESSHESETADMRRLGRTGIGSKPAAKRDGLSDARNRRKRPENDH